MSRSKFFAFAFAFALVGGMALPQSSAAADSIFGAYLQGLAQEAGRETFRQAMRYLLTSSPDQATYSHQTQSAYTVVYSGEDGVNVRDEPGGRLLATAQMQQTVPIGALSAPVMFNGVPWIKVEIVGWMARKKHTRDSSYFADLGNGLSRVTWDGNGNSNDNFIALKPLPDISSPRAARVFTGTDIYTGEGVVGSSFEWVPARLVGWMAMQSSKGTRLLARTN